jgi:hypothetical protein
MLFLGFDVVYTGLDFIPSLLDAREEYDKK